MNDSEFNSKSEIAEEKLMMLNTEEPVSISPDTSNTETICLRHSGLAYCPICEKAVQLLSFIASADLFKTDPKDIEMLATQGTLHRVHNRLGVVSICSDSLFHCFNSRETRLLDSRFESRSSKF